MHHPVRQSLRPGRPELGSDRAWHDSLTPSRGGAIHSVHGTLVRDYFYVGDAVLAYLQLVEAMADDAALRGEAFNFSAETPVSVLELVGMLRQIIGTDVEPEIAATATHEIASQHLSAKKARKLLGWASHWPLEEALTETVSWYGDYLSETS